MKLSPGINILSLDPGASFPQLSLSLFFFFLIVLFDLEISPSTSSCVQFFFFTESSVASWEIYILIVSMSGWSTDAFKSWIGTFFFSTFLLLLFVEVPLL